jgi:hypothetical protein
MRPDMAVFYHTISSNVQPSKTSPQDPQLLSTQMISLKLLLTLKFLFFGWPFKLPARSGGNMSAPGFQRGTYYN